ncbi:RNA polymerase sigma factor [Marinilabiliaceae bacterium JC017]|nr:RNA polymerase sigma factor [Marinilabiliaceae bacterium JC017]
MLFALFFLDNFKQLQYLKLSNTNTYRVNFIIFAPPCNVTCEIIECVIERSFQRNYRSKICVLNRKKNDKNKIYRQLFDQFSSYGFSIALRFVSNRDDALEVVNDSFLKLFSSMDERMGENQIKAFFRKIVINTSIDHYRKTNRRPDNLELDVSIRDDQTSDAEQNLSAQEILKALKQLPDVQRYVFTLHEIEGYSHEEIALKLEINTNTSRSHLRRAKSKLQQILQFHERQLG